MGPSQMNLQNTHTKVCGVCVRVCVRVCACVCVPEDSCSLDVPAAGFSDLLIEDQMSLLKASFMELNVFRLAYRSVQD